MTNDKTAPPLNSNRTTAYLLAYLEIAGSRLFGTGIPVEGEFIHLDRAIMKTLLISDIVEIDEAKSGLFSLTTKGLEYVRDIKSSLEIV